MPPPPLFKTEITPLILHGSCRLSAQHTHFIYNIGWIISNQWRNTIKFQQMQNFQRSKKTNLLMFKEYLHSISMLWYFWGVSLNSIQASASVTRRPYIYIKNVPVMGSEFAIRGLALFWKNLIKSQIMTVKLNR